MDRIEDAREQLRKVIYDRDMCECGAATDAGKVAEMEAKLEAEVSGAKSVRIYEVIR